MLLDTYTADILWHETKGRRRLFELLLYDRFKEFECKMEAAIVPYS